MGKDQVQSFMFDPSSASNLPMLLDELFNTPSKFLVPLLMSRYKSILTIGPLLENYD